MSAALEPRPSLYSTSVGKKYAMAISGIVLMGWVLAHMIGNLKVFFGESSLDRYSEWLRQVGEPLFPPEALLWTVRVVLLAAVAVHIHAAYQLTMINRRARVEAYRSKRDYVVADFASRTMRWTGVIVLLFVIFHLLDLTWGPANPDFISRRAVPQPGRRASSACRWRSCTSSPTSRWGCTSTTAPGASFSRWAGCSRGGARSLSASRP